MLVKQQITWYDKLDAFLNRDNKNAIIKGYIEEVHIGESKDILFISNKPETWRNFFSYYQLGIVDVEKGHDFKDKQYVMLKYVEGVIVEIELDKNNDLKVEKC